MNSEGDDLPGLVVDVFGEAAALQVTTLGMALRRPMLLAALQEVLAPEALFEVASPSYAELEGFAAQSRVVSGAGGGSGLLPGGRHRSCRSSR